MCLLSATKPTKASITIGNKLEILRQLEEMPKWLFSERCSQGVQCPNKSDKTMKKTIWFQK
jgi:hypothetical protein